jgi:glycosyltransferase involved in cell wall biosynthesis
MTGPARRVYVDQTHLRGHITGLERVALDLFRAEALHPHVVRPVRSEGLLSMIAAQQLGLLARGLTDRSAFVLCPGFPPGPLTLTLEARCLTYIHDTFPLDRREELNWKGRLYIAPSFALAMRFGRRFFVNSRTTGTALRRHCAPDALVALLRPAARDVFGLGGLTRPAPYEPGRPLRLLAIGTIEPRKDYSAAVAIVSALNAGGVAAELDIVGRFGWGRHPGLDSPPPFVRLHGYLPDDHLRQLSGECHLLLSTSKAEGLGLPLLEVQHGGLPVVAPDAPIFDEVLEGSGLLVSPTDATAAAGAIRAWVEAGRLAEASAMARGNLARWNRLAAADLDRFREFLAMGLTAYSDPAGVIGAGPA